MSYRRWKFVEERLVHPLDNVVESQWRILVEVWEKDVKKQEMCAVNKENMKKQNFHHTTGSKPHAKCAAEKSGRRPKRHEVFEVTHTKKKKTEDPDEVLMEPEVAAELKEMKEVEIQASQPSSRLCYKDDMMHLQKCEDEIKGVVFAV
ncbi:hypothetical protein C5167_045358 [Papaver somniferum]|uniref:Uncharacterized protein n=1 Tax=Papaver somniferum TaxID=3469 RepID=A0A4Y7LAN3_PAPSO|nr:hypothetical protein C5167_045358 [Papaver somniferum]